MSHLVLHPKTRAAIERFVRSPAHALLLTGPAGSGKQALASEIAAMLLGLTPEQLGAYPYFLLADAPTPSISIETIREQQQFLCLKTVGKQSIRRILLLPNAGRMTVDAQNAFLKTLEEPPADTVLLLTATSSQSLLPTILSRLQTITVQPIAEVELKQHFAKTHSAAAIDRAYLLSGGHPGLMTALLHQDQTHPLIAAVEQAKTILQATTFERLSLVDQLAKQKDQLPPFLQALNHIATTALTQAAAQQNAAKINRWHHIRKATHQTQKALAQSANPKLLLTNLMLTL